MKKMEKNKFTAPVEKLGQEVKAYGDAKLNTLKLQTAKGLSQGIASVTAFLLLFILGSAFVLVLAMGLILLLGEMLGSYATAAFYVSGVLFLVFLIVLLARKRLFRNSFISSFVNVFESSDNESPEAVKKEKISTWQELDMAIMKSQVQEYKQEARIVKQVSRVKSSFSPELIISGIIKRFIGKK